LTTGDQPFILRISNPQIHQQHLKMPGGDGYHIISFSSPMPKGSLINVHIITSNNAIWQKGYLNIKHQRYAES
jgi:hypothetical protein